MYTDIRELVDTETGTSVYESDDNMSISTINHTENMEETVNVNNDDIANRSLDDAVSVDAEMPSEKSVQPGKVVQSKWVLCKKSFCLG